MKHRKYEYLTKIISLWLSDLSAKARANCLSSAEHTSEGVIYWLSPTP